jgi:hypothetical protein
MAAFRSLMIACLSIVLVLPAVTPCRHAVAGEAQDAVEEAGEGTLPDDDDEGPGAVMQSIYEGQEAISRSVTTLSHRMDRMFGTDETFPEEAYDSFLRLRYIQRIDEGGGGEPEFTVGGRLSLPSTRERLSLVFLTDDYDDPLDRERRTEREIEEATRQSLALRLQRPSRRLKTSISAGLRSGDPIDLMTRLSVWRDFKPRSWHIRPAQTMFWYDERGAGGTTDFRVQHPIGAAMLLRSDSSATWFRRDEQYYYNQVFSLFQPVARRRDLLWQIGVQAESEPNNHVTRYYAQVRWRSVVHRDWLVFELRPQALRDRENAFRTQLRLFLGFELLFGELGD